MNRQIKGVMVVLVLGLLAWSTFELDRQLWRPDRLRAQATTNWNLDQKRSACFARPDSLVILGNSILHAVRDSLEALPGVAVWSVPGEYALHLDKWAAGLDDQRIKAVAVALGANDLLAGYEADTLRQNYAAFRARMTAAGKYTYTVPVVPFELGASTYIRPGALDEARVAYNQWPQDAGDALQEAERFPAAVWHDFTSDGVHPNEKGRTLLANFYKAYCLLD
ncbi:MAG: SGNH/GDSL hydrolase family protein [Flavobacteriales bacterium]